MADTSCRGAAPAARTSTVGALKQALARLADALDRPDPGDDEAYGAAFAAVLNLVDDKFLDARAEFIGNVVAQLAADARNERLFDAWVHFMDHFSGYVLQGEQTSATRYVYALAGVLGGVPPHHHVARVESTEAIARALSQAAFGRDGCVRVAPYLEAPASVEPDFFGFLQFYSVRRAPEATAAPDDESEANLSASPEDDARWMALSDDERADEAAEREVVLAVCVQPPDGDESDYAQLLQRLCAWAGQQPDGFALDYRIDGTRYRATLAVLDLGPPFSTARRFRQFLMRRDLDALIAHARRAAGEGGSLHAVVSLVAPQAELDEDADEPLARPSVALFAGGAGRFVAGAHLGSAAELAEQLAEIRQALADGGIDAVRFVRMVRPEAGPDGESAYYDEAGGQHPPRRPTR